MGPGRFGTSDTTSILACNLRPSSLSALFWRHAMARITTALSYTCATIKYWRSSHLVFYMPYSFQRHSGSDCRCCSSATMSSPPTYKMAPCPAQKVKPPNQKSFTFSLFTAENSPRQQAKVSAFAHFNSLPHLKQLSVTTHQPSRRIKKLTDRPSTHTIHRLIKCRVTRRCDS